MVALLGILNDEPDRHGFQKIRRRKLYFPLSEILFKIQEKLIPTRDQRLVNQQWLGSSPVLCCRDRLDLAVRIALKHRQIAPHAGAWCAVKGVNCMYR